MQRPIMQLFSPPQLSISEITGHLPHWCSYQIPYAKAERTVISEGTIISQYHSHVLFFIEMMEINLHKALEASYHVSEPSLFLFMMLDGTIQFFTSGGQPIKSASAAICYATYNKTGSYVYRLSPGIHRLCYLCPMPRWMDRNSRRYPRLKPFLAEMAESELLFGHLPACSLDEHMQSSLLRLLTREDSPEADLESTLSRDAKEVIDAYQALLEIKYEQRAYRLKAYLDENYANPKLSNPALAAIFHTTEKTLVRDFSHEFSITPHAYLIQVRMHRAKAMIDNGIHINRVYPQVGYADLRSFGKQFKIFFGFPPSEYR